MLNGSQLRATDLELYPVYLALAEGTLSEPDFAAWLRRHIQTVPSDEVHEPRSGYGT